MKKGNPTRLKWADSHYVAFQTLKSSLTKCPNLKLLNIMEIFIPQTHASDKALEEVLLQEENGL